MTHLSHTDHSPARQDLEDPHSRRLDLPAVRGALRALAADRGPVHDPVGRALSDLADGLVHHASLPSTQPLALAEGTPWRAVSTDHQTAGRGRLGRGWENPAGSGIAVSVVLPLTGGVDAVDLALAASRTPRWGQVPLCVGAAVHEALSALGLPTGVKWPNDVLSRTSGRKLAGILCQVGEGGRSVVAGIGLNVWPTAGLSAEAAGRSASVCDELRAVHGPGWEPPADLREQVLTGVLHRLAVWHAAWLAEGIAPELADADHGPLTDRLAAVSATLGQEVDLHLPGGEIVRGTATGLAPSGGLLVEVAGEPGEGPREFQAADVVHLRPAT